LDLHLSSERPSPAEREAVDSVLGAPESGWDGGERHIERDGHTSSASSSVSSHRHLLLPVFHAIQARVGWLSPGALNYACRRLHVPPAEAFGVASFYGMFSLNPQPPAVLRVCDDIGCLARGAEAQCKKLEAAVGPPGTPSPDGSATWVRSTCLGLCERAPAAVLSIAGEHPHDAVLAPAGSEQLMGAVLDPKSQAGGIPWPEVNSVPRAGTLGLRLLRRIGKIDPESIDAYRACGGYQALRRALRAGPEKIQREVLESKLVGRGGAAFPTGRKWDPFNRPYYLVCNADESEPGTFKDRILMEGDPFALIEAMTIAAFAAGCKEGFLYIRGEYSVACSRIQNAVQVARARGFLGHRIMGSDFSFDIEIRRGAGAYICGEETALFNSIEGYRGEPRNKPPFPTQSGLFGKPTVVNNVETLVNVLNIVTEGGARYAAKGTAASTGTKLFCLSGHIRNPGVYEIPFGTTLRQLLELGGGISGSGRLQAILLGGASGTFVSPRELDTPLTFEATRAIGATLGSGVVMCFDDTTDLKSILLRIASFFREESCGQCIPCRIGTMRQEEVLLRSAARKPLGGAGEELKLLKELGQAMRDASICGLGQTASSAIESAIARGLIEEWVER
jgi:NADH-quinone oxidoreductase subunit F